MFREVARKKQALSREECVDILKKARRGVLSVLGDDGYPYGVPLNHWYNEEDGRIYFHGGKAGHKIDAMKRCPKASFSVTDGGAKADGEWWLTFRSVVVFGRIEFVEDTDRAMAIARSLSLGFTGDEAYIEDEIRRSGPATLCFALVPEHVTGKRVTEK
ncbi:MAG: pyridoxamine 5'-phosphate oxidase family protein [Clostridia bacterium]|nr:pyridoxamine 5'-phosphate oxidase family protein [Clostridia bacterium]